jgi:prepilin-type N-terminal cleavage/methylation domain-containing protein/prepilin-type processing-associated H-X9-DG protein
MTPRSSRGPGRAAFSLVELLIVITIIGMLVALLVPVSTAAYDYALTIKCRSNMRQIAAAALQYAATNQQWIVPAVYFEDGEGRAYSGNLLDRPHWCNILVDSGYTDAPNTASLGTSPASTKEENIFQCPAGTEDLWPTTSTYPTAPAPSAPAVLGFLRLGRSGHKIDCWYYWNGSSDTAIDPFTQKMHALDFPSMAVPVGAGVHIADVKLDPRLGFHRLDGIKDLTSTVMLADGVGMDAGTDPVASNRARIAARHAGDGGRRSVTNAAFWDGHVEAIDRGESPSEDGVYLMDHLHSSGRPYFRLSDQGF